MIQSHAEVGLPRVPVRVQRVGPLDFARIGGMVGAAFALIPCLLFAFAGVTSVHWVRRLFDQWAQQETRLPIINVGLSLNFVRLLGLENTHQSIAYWDDRLGLTFIALWLTSWLVFTLLCAFFAAVVAFVYNLSAHLGGGVQLDVSPRR